MQENQDSKAYEKLRGILINVQRDITNALDTIKRIEELEKKELYKSMPGVEGVFDGTYLIADDGQKLEVPANYAAKSRLVFGDRLKVIEEGDNKLFKQIIKPERQRVEGILSKKEGKWHLLTPTGTYRISDTAAEYNFAEINDKAVGLVPRDNTNAPFAALDKVEKPAGFVAPNTNTAKTAPAPQSRPEVKTTEHKSESKVAPKPSPVPTPTNAPHSNASAPRRQRPPRERDSRDDREAPRRSRPSEAPRQSAAPKVSETPINREFVADITKNTVTLSDDDLR
jgi:hypothetical protein